MEKTTKKRVKHAILGVTSVALVAGVTSALTMAMLSDMESAENTFTANPSLSAALYEPTWNGKNIDPSTGVTVGSDQSYEAGVPGDGDPGEEVAKSYVPGTPINKNPFVVNDSDSGEYVALRVTYQVKCNNSNLSLGTSDVGHCGTFGKWHTISPADFKRYFANTSYGTTAVLPAEIDALSDEQKRVSTSVKSAKQYNDEKFILDETATCDYYYYGKKNAAGEGEDTLTVLEKKTATPNLFTEVIPLEFLDIVDEDASGNHHMFPVTGCDGCERDKNYDVHDDHGPLYDINKNEVVIETGNSDGLPVFRIVVVAAAVQTDNIGDVSAIKTELQKCFPKVTNLNDLTD